jgi:hypothetical protein
VGTFRDGTHVVGIIAARDGAIGTESPRSVEAAGIYLIGIGN